jgi:hypothetical protein
MLLMKLKLITIVGRTYLKKQIKGLKRYGVSVIPGIERSIHKHDYKLENTTDMATDVISTSSLSSVIFIATNAHKSEDYLKGQ